MYFWGATGPRLRHTALVYWNVTQNGIAAYCFLLLGSVYLVPPQVFTELAAEPHMFSDTARVHRLLASR